MADSRETTRFAKGGGQVNCPNCGNLLPRRFRYAKLVVCDNCRSILYIRRDDIDARGTQAKLVDHPSLFRLYQRFVYRDLLLEPVGMLRYGYGRGFWEEWWCLDGEGAGRWISVDEGDFVMEQKQDPGITGLPAADTLEIGRIIELLDASWTVTELGTARFQGMQGELPEIVDRNRSFRYAHLERPGRRLLTLEYDAPAELPDLYLGEWMDPFEIKAL